MLRRILRILVGFVLASLAAAAATVAFADIQELRALSTDTARQLMPTFGERVLFAAFQGALFSTPIAAIGILVGEWRRIQSWTYYTLLALAITFLGFMAWSSYEVAGEPTIVNNYAMTAFLTTGFVGGIVYWLFSGRNAGSPAARRRYDFVKTPADSAREGGSAPKKTEPSAKSTVVTSKAAGKTTSKKETVAASSGEKAAAPSAAKPSDKTAAKPSTDTPSTGPSSTAAAKPADSPAAAPEKASSLGGENKSAAAATEKTTTTTTTTTTTEPKSDVAAQAADKAGQGAAAKSATSVPETASGKKDS